MWGDSQIQLQRLRLVHGAHAAGAWGAAAVSCASFLGFLDVGHQSFGGEHEARDGSGVLQSETGYFGRVNHACLDQVAVFAGVRVVAEVLVLGFADFAQNDGTFVAGIVDDLAERLFKGALHDVDADGIVIMQLELIESRDAADQSHTAAGNDAFLDSRAGCVHRIFDASLLFLQLGLGCGADFNDGNAADEFRKALLQLFLVVVGGGVFHLRANLTDAAFDFRSLAAAFDDGGVVLINGDLLGAAEIFGLHVLELDAQIFGDGLAAGERGDVFEHGLAAISEARSLHGSALQGAAELVDDESGESFTFDVFSDDQKRFALLGDLLEKRQQVLHRGDFLFMDEDADVFHRAFHAFGVSDEVGRKVAAVKLHTFDDLERRFHGLGLFHGDDAVLADFLHRTGNDVADVLVVVRADGADLGDHVALDILMQTANFLNGHFDGLFDAALQCRGAGTGCNRLHAFAEDGLGKYGGCGGAVAGYVGSLGRDFTHHLGAHVLERILQLDFLGDGYAVLGDDRRAELLFDHRIAALGAEGDFDCVGELINAAQDRLAGIFTSHDLLCHDVFLLFCIANWLSGRRLRPRPGSCVESGLAFAGCFGSGAELREDLVFLHDHEFLAVNGDVVAAVLAEQDAVTGFYVEGDQFTFFAAAGADGDDFTLLWVLFCGVRDDDATLDGFLFFQAPH